VTTNRDRAIEQLIGRQMADSASAAQTPACLDAGTVAAWMDGGLAREDVAAAEAHTAGCARCQAMVAAMARTTPAPSSPSSWRFRLRWAIPIATAAAAAVLWITVAPQDRPAIVPAIEPAAESKAAPAVDEKAVAGARAAVEPSAGPPQPQPSASARDRRQTATTDKIAKFEEREANASPRRADTAAAAQPPPAAVAPPPSAVAPSVPTPRAQPAAAAPSQVAEFDALASRVRVVGGTIGLLQVVSPDPLVRWRLSAAGTVERSTDGGVTWASQQLGTVATIAAGSSPSPTICWLVGRGGAVLLSTDGRTWQRLAFPVESDFVAVRATDARTATITASDGRQFSTLDGGKTWSLQEKLAVSF
jgi:hypothetical protein